MKRTALGCGWLTCEMDTTGLPSRQWRNIITFLLAWIGCFSFGMARDAVVKDPIADYVTPLAAEFEMGVVEKIFRTEIDVNGDGKKVVFLSDTPIRRAGFEWDAYIPVKHGYVRAFRSTAKESLTFDPYSYVGYVDEIKHRGIVSHAGKVVDGLEYYAFWIQGITGKVKTIGSGEPEGTEPQTVNRSFQRYFADALKKEPPPIKVDILTADDLRARGYRIPKKKEP